MKATTQKVIELMDLYAHAKSRAYRALIYGELVGEALKGELTARSFVRHIARAKSGFATQRRPVFPRRSNGDGTRRTVN